MIFQMWSPFHYFMIIFSFVFPILLFFIFKNREEKIQRRVSLGLALLMIGILIIRNVYIYVKHGELNPEVIPFQVCHFANFIFLLAIVSKNRVWSTIAWCLNFPAGLVSIVFADGLQKYETMLNIQAIAYIAGHMLIVILGLYMLLMGQLKISFKELRMSYLYVGVGFFLSILINSYFNHLFAKTEMDANYFYTYKPENGTPLESMFSIGKNIEIGLITFNPIYILLLAFLGFIVMAIMYGIARLRVIK